jgi:hypothetical protein
MKLATSLLVVATLAVLVVLTEAQQRRPLSPPGTSATQVGGQWVKNEQGGQSYQGGQWIEVTYGRPIKRGRADLFGSGENYGKALSAGGPVWRAGANQTTRLRTEVPLVFEGKTVPAGEYSVLVDLKPNTWTLILSSQPSQEKYDPANKTALWGAYNYTPAQDVARAPMTVGTLPFSMDQLTIVFVDMANDGGKLAMMWDKTIATVPFKVGS